MRLVDAYLAEASRYLRRIEEARQAEERDRAAWLDDVKRRLGLVTDGLAPASCDVCWGSHACRWLRGHPEALPHECDCCQCERHPDPGDVLCVGKPPYYGPGTRFYGADAESLGLPLVKRLHFPQM